MLKVQHLSKEIPPEYLNDITFSKEESKLLQTTEGLEATLINEERTLFITNETPFLE